jgi:Tol biopolymer transport system component
MNGNDELALSLRRHYLATADETVAEGRLELVLEQTRAARQRPGWLARLREPFLRAGGRVEASRKAWVLVLVVVAALLAVALAVALSAPPVRSTSPLLFTTTVTETGGGRLYAIDPTGGSPWLVFDAAAQRVHASPDGRYALFQAVLPGWTGLVLARTDGSSARPIGEPGEFELGRAWETIWAPDSHAVAWVSSRAAGPVLMVADTVGGAPREIELPAGGRPQLAWSPDSVHLAVMEFGCDIVDGTLSIVDTRDGMRRVIGPRLHVRSGPVWSHDGRRVALKGATDDVDCPGEARPSELVVGDVATGVATTVARNVEITVDAWSADDLSILGMVQAGTGSDIVAVSVETGQMTRLGHFAGQGATWSHDGSRLVWPMPDPYSSPGAEESNSLWVMDIKSGRSTRVAQNVPGWLSEGFPMWSPDDAWIAFERAPSVLAPNDDVGRRGSIWMVRPDGRGEHVLVDESTGVDLGGVDW